MTLKGKIERAVLLTDSRLCVDLALDRSLLKEYDHEFAPLAAVIEATKDQACAYNLKLGSFEVLGRRMYDFLKFTVDWIRRYCPDALIIADGKRGDIGLSGEAYARSARDMGYDAVTVNPYMGGDALTPFRKVEDLGVFVLCVTSNSSAVELQDEVQQGYMYCLYEHVATKALKWNIDDSLGLVVSPNPLFWEGDDIGAVERVRNIAPDLPILVDGLEPGAEITGDGVMIVASGDFMDDVRNKQGEFVRTDETMERLRVAARTRKNAIRCLSSNGHL